MNELRTVRLYGKMGAMFGREFKLAVRSPGEAVQALIAQLPGLEAYLIGAKSKGIGFLVYAGKRNLTEDDLTSPVGDDAIRIAPVLYGAGSGWGQIIGGLILVVAGAFVTGMTFGAASAVGGAMIGAGVSMIVGGVMTLLAPQPKLGKPDERPENTPSYSFSGAVNTQAQGHPVPVLYGRLIIGSAVVSAGIVAVDDAIIPHNAPRTGGGGRGGGGYPGYQNEWSQL